MAETILQQGDGWRISQSDVATTTVPYGPCAREDGNSNHGFLELRVRPEAVAEIPEARQSEGLAELLVGANACGSPLMSVGCGYWITEDPEFTVAAELPWFARGYIAITYRDDTRNSDPQRLVDLATGLLFRVGGSEEHFINFAFDVVPLRGFF